MNPLAIAIEESYFDLWAHHVAVIWSEVDKYERRESLTLRLAWLAMLVLLEQDREWKKWFDCDYESAVKPRIKEEAQVFWRIAKDFTEYPDDIKRQRQLRKIVRRIKAEGGMG